MTFPVAPLDRFTRMVSFAVVVFLALATGLLAATIPEPGPSLAAVLFGIAVLGISFGYAPAAFETAPGQLRVHRRLFGVKAFALGGTAGRVSWRIGLGSIRLVGSGGLWGWYGLFWRRDVGSYRAYVTDRSRLVACETADGRAVLVSPADPEAFVRALEAVRA
jgi:hypothetical protein